MLLAQKVMSIQIMQNKKKWQKDCKIKIIILFEENIIMIKMKSLISKLGLLNSMFGKTHSEETKNLMRSRKVKYPNRVGIYQLDNRL